MRNLKIAGIIVSVIMSIAIWALTQSNARLKERSRSSDNALRIVSEGFKLYRASDGLKSAQIEGLELRLSQLSNVRPAIKQEVNALPLKGRDVQAITDARISYRDTITVFKRDSVVIRSHRVDTLECLTYSDQYFSVSGCSEPGRADAYKVDYSVRDSLIIVESVKYRRFLGFLWKTKRIKDRRVDIKSRNPKIKIDHLEFIRVVK